MCNHFSLIINFVNGIERARRTRSNKNCPAVLFSVIEKGLTGRKARFIIKMPLSTANNMPISWDKEAFWRLIYYETGSLVFPFSCLKSSLLDVLQNFIINFEKKIILWIWLKKSYKYFWKKCSYLTVSMKHEERVTLGFVCNALHRFRERNEMKIFIYPLFPCFLFIFKKCHDQSYLKNIKKIFRDERRENLNIY